jgi:hypothetical protein
MARSPQTHISSIKKLKGATMDDDQKVTVGELKRLLRDLPDNDLISFSGGLTVSQLKRWGDHEHVVEFNEPEGHLTAKFKKRHPHVQAVFISTKDPDWHVDLD